MAWSLASTLGKLIAVSLPAADALGQPITRSEMQDDITKAVTSEVNTQAPTLVNQAIDTIKEDEFGGGSIFSQRMDGNRTRQLRSDTANFTDRAQGGLG